MISVVNDGETCLVQWRGKLLKPSPDKRVVMCGVYTYGLTSGAVLYLQDRAFGRPYLTREELLPMQRWGRAELPSERHGFTDKESPPLNLCQACTRVLVLDSGASAVSDC